ncbi:MAG: GNAT family N-acetyltransferase [Burkholderiales bacterium RIFCSPLOWO2_12_FULL_61_40]|nr:MAG: GNAT family N-acetyltransferase [Burkholderiales bacterium RIFCSPLOWO2_12_FULL_61_40]
MNHWQFRPVPFKFQLSDWTLFSASVVLQVRAENALDETRPTAPPSPADAELMEGSQGFLIRGQPIAQRLPIISHVGGFFRYVPLQYQHCYIDLQQSFDSYRSKFSSKTRSTLTRKLRKYSQHCGGGIPWKTYQTPAQMRDFFRAASAVSKLSYQERLLDVGIPNSEAFIVQAESLAAEQKVRAYVLFDGARPVSYLYCPAQGDTLSYSYLGYDPQYMQLSVGTVIQWLAVEQLFREARFRYFDFTEGQSEHKRLFSTHQRLCANVFLLKKTFRNRMIIYSHLGMGQLSQWLGEFTQRVGIKTRIKKILRFAI